MKSLNILLVEDNEGDVLLIKEAFEESKVINTINVLKDGRQAIDFFEHVTGKAHPPDLVLLDINLPKMNGHEVLRYLKNNTAYMHIPVIMLTTSSSQKDILQCYENHVNCYITKPIEADDFFKAITQIESFWINIVTLP